MRIRYGDPGAHVGIQFLKLRKACAFSISYRLIIQKFGGYKSILAYTVRIPEGIRTVGQHYKDQQTCNYGE